MEIVTAVSGPPRQILCVRLYFVILLKERKHFILILGPRMTSDLGHVDDLSSNELIQI